MPKLEITTQINKQMDKGAFVAGTAQFFSKCEAVMPNAPKIPLNRAGDGCMVGIDELQAHNHHIPMFSSEDGLNGYVERVNKAAQEALAIYSETHPDMFGKFSNN